jgi:signal transduction histidine kinase
VTTKDIQTNRRQDIDPSGGPEIDKAIDYGYNSIISTISHELRTPVAIIKSNIQLLRKFCYNIEHSILEESFSLCEESVDDVQQFLDNIQLVNNANKVRIVPICSSFRVKAIVHHLYSKLAQHGYDYQRIVLQWDLKDYEITSDKNYLSQILSHILSNALKFSEKKVYLTISTVNGDISITVQDSGIGIPEDEVNSVFQPFYKASNAKHVSGAGLGLAIVYSFVEKLRGKILVSSSIDTGTTIKIIISNELSNQDSCN